MSCYSDSFATDKLNIQIIYVPVVNRPKKSLMVLTLSHFPINLYHHHGTQRALQEGKQPRGAVLGYKDFLIRTYKFEHTGI